VAIPEERFCSEKCGDAYAPLSTLSSNPDKGLHLGEEEMGNRDGLSTLEACMREQLDALDAKTSMCAKHLLSGREIPIRADEPVNALSTIKIAVMALAYRDAEAGELDLDQRYRIRPEDLRRGSGLLQTFAPGLQPTYRDLVTQMIVTSDNTATDIMIARLGLERINALLDQFGYAETRLQTTTGALFRRVWELVDPAHASLSDREVYERGFPTDPKAPARRFLFEGDPSAWLGRTTAREMSRLLEQIQNGELASRAHSDEMLSILQRQFYSSRLPQRIRFRATIGHKTGDWPPVAGNDVGIIYSDGGPIVVSVFATQNRGDFFELEATHGRIAELLLDAWGSAA
jgi:beta-lactamase class A